MIESRNEIDCFWETIAGLICIDVSEAQSLVDAYQKDRFDINDYRVRECTKIEYVNTPCPIRMASPRIMKKGDK